MDRSVEYRDKVSNAKGSPLATDVFVTARHDHISAVLYSTADCANLPAVPGQDFIVIHNPNAANPLSRHWIPIGEEYWLQNDEITQHRNEPRTDCTLIE